MANLGGYLSSADCTDTNSCFSRGDNYYLEENDNDNKQTCCAIDHAIDHLYMRTRRAIDGDNIVNFDKTFKLCCFVCNCENEEHDRCKVSLRITNYHGHADLNVSLPQLNPLILLPFYNIIWKSFNHSCYNHHPPIMYVGIDNAVLLICSSTLSVNTLLPAMALLL
jgi:hypothetical protein